MLVSLTILYLGMNKEKYLNLFQMRSLSEAMFGWQSLRVRVIYLKTIVSTVAKNIKTNLLVQYCINILQNVHFWDKFECSWVPFIFTFLSCSPPLLPPCNHS